ncbi:hypothetical protein C8Q75DRAFT_863901 [Abortiporus biennis]|nr:hypothetical protein C8Q75DRAFT_863901 [Abortiporus biennis]
MPIVNSKMPWAMAHGATLTAILKDFGFKTYGLKKKDMEDILVQIEKSGLDSVIERQTHRAPEIVLDNDDNDQDFIPENTTGTSHSTNVDDHEMSEEDDLQEDEHTPRRSTRNKRKRDEADDEDSNEDIRPLTSSPTTRLSTRNTRNKRRAPTPPMREIQSRAYSAISPAKEESHKWSQQKTAST